MRHSKTWQRCMSAVLSIAMIMGNTAGSLTTFAESVEYDPAIEDQMLEDAGEETLDLEEISGEVQADAAVGGEDPAASELTMESAPAASQEEDPGYEDVFLIEDPETEDLDEEALLSDALEENEEPAEPAAAERPEDKPAAAEQPEEDPAAAEQSEEKQPEDEQAAEPQEAEPVVSETAVGADTAIDTDADIDASVSEEAEEDAVAAAGSETAEGAVPADDSETAQDGEGEQNGSSEGTGSEEGTGTGSEGEGGEDTPAVEEGVTALTEGTAQEVTIAKRGETAWLSFTPETSGLYMFASDGTYDTAAKLYLDREADPIAENDDGYDTGVENQSDFRIAYALTAGETYYLAVYMCYEDVTGTFDVAVSYERPAIESVTYAGYPRQTYYAGYDTSTSSYGGMLEVKYTDDTSEQLSFSSYSSRTEEYTSYSLNIPTQTIDGTMTLVPGTYTMKVSYLDWSGELPVTVKEFDEIPSVSMGEEAVLGLLDLVSFTAEEAGYYAFSATADSNVSWYVRDANKSTVSAVVNTSSSGNYFRFISLEAGQTVYMAAGANSYTAGAGNIRICIYKPADITKEPVSGSGSGYHVVTMMPEKGNMQVDLAYQGSIQNMSMRTLSTSVSYSYRNLASGNAEVPEGYDGLRRISYTNSNYEEPLYLIWKSSGNWSATFSKGSRTAIEQGDNSVTVGTEQKQFSYNAPKSGLYMFYIKADEDKDIDMDYSFSGEGSWCASDSDSSNAYYFTAYAEEGTDIILTVSSETEDTACTITVTSIGRITNAYVSKLPSKTSYLSSEQEIQLSGLEITAEYEDGTSEVISYDNGASEKTRGGFSYSYESLYSGRYLKPGDHQISIGYMNQTCTFQIHVDQAELGTDAPWLTAGTAAQVDTRNLPADAYGDRWLQYRFKPETSGFYSIDVTGTTYTVNGSGEAIPQTSVSYVPDVYDQDGISLTGFSVGQNVFLWYLQAGETYLLEKDIYMYGDRYAVLNVLAQPYETAELTEAGTDITAGTASPFVWTYTPQVSGTHIINRAASSSSYSNSVMVRNQKGNQISQQVYRTSSDEDTYYGSYLFALEKGKTYLITGSFNSDETRGRMSISAPDVLTNKVPVELTTDHYGHSFNYTAPESGEVNFIFRADSSFYLNNWYLTDADSGESITYTTNSNQANGHYYYCITTPVEEGRTYSLGFIQDYLEEGASYSLGINVNDIENAQEMTLGQPYLTSINTGEEDPWYSFTPEKTARYRFYSFDPDTSSINHYVRAYMYHYIGKGSENSSYASTGYHVAMTDELLAGETYYYQVGFDYSSYTGDFYVQIDEAVEPVSLEIVRYPQNHYAAGADTQMSWSLLTVKAQLEDGSEEVVAYNGTGEKSGYSPEVTLSEEPVYEGDKLAQKEYTALVTYGTAQTSFPVIVGDVPALEAAADGDPAATVTWGEDNTLTWTTDVSETGIYMVQVSMNGAYPYVYIREDGKSVSYITYDSSSQVKDGKTIYTNTYLYMLEKGTKTLALNPSRYTLGSADNITIDLLYKKIPDCVSGEELTGSIQGSSSNYGYFQLQVDQEGFYEAKVDAQRDTSSSFYISSNLYKVTDSGYSNVTYGNSSNSNYGSVSSGDSRIYHCVYDAGYYLTKGTYLYRLRLPEGNYSIRISSLEETQLSNPLDGTHTGYASIRTYDAIMFKVPVAGSYTIRYASNASDYNSITLLKPDGTYASASDYQTDESGRYVKALTSELEADTPYLFRFPGYGGTDYTISLEEPAHIEQIEILTYPKTVYYYKLDKLTLSTNLASNIRIRATYSDGRSEDLYSYSTGSISGTKFTCTLPDDVPCSGGYVLPGQYTATLSYLNKQLQIPIEVRKVTQMPFVQLDENGQGSYSGPFEQQNGNGYIRFTAPRDGFYDLTMSVTSDSDIYYSSIWNSLYQTVDYNSSSQRTSGRYINNASVYVSEGQTCYISYSRSSYGSAGTFALTVERSPLQDIKELQLGTFSYVQNLKTNEAHWFSFTPEESGTYLFSTDETPGYNYMQLYTRPDSAQAISENYNYSSDRNGTDELRSYNLTAGKTYYLKSTCNYLGDYQIVVVKKASAVKLELLTEGEIYCSSLEDYIDTSFADLAFRVTYDDGTTEDITYGYKGTSTRYISLQGVSMSDPTIKWDIVDGRIVDKEYPARFRYGSTYVDATVIARSIADLDSIDGTLNATVQKGVYQYYKFTPEEDGYYRVLVTCADAAGTASLYDPYMIVMAPDYAESVTGSSYTDIGVYALTVNGTDGTVNSYCLRLENETEKDSIKVQVKIEKLPEVTALTIDSLPQTDYYLGIDTKYSVNGLKVTAEYADGTTEPISAGERSAKTGISLRTHIDSEEEDVDYLGTSTGSRTIYVDYMGASTTYSIYVKDTSDAPQLTLGAETAGEMASAYDTIYLQYTPDESGFYRFNLRADETGTTPVIREIRNSTYAAVQTYQGASTVADGKTTSSVVAYLLAGKGYFLKGALQDSNKTETAGVYTGSIERITDLRDGVQTDTAAANDTVYYQYTVPETGYYQFTLDSDPNVKLRLFNSAMNAASFTTGSKDGKNRAYYVARLTEGSVYMVAVDNSKNGTEQAYSVFAGKKPEVTAVTLESAPSRTVYYAEFENTVNTDGLAIRITYEDGSDEVLAYGARSSWGVGMSLDYSEAEKDEAGHLTEGTQTIQAVYLDQKVPFEVRIEHFDITKAGVLDAETVTDLTSGAGESVFYTFTPEVDTKWHLYTRNTVPAAGYIYTQDYELVVSDVGVLGDPDCSIIAELEKDTTYIVRLRAADGRSALAGTVKAHDTLASVEVTGVNILEKKVCLNLDSDTKSRKINIEVAPADADNKNVTITSSDESVVTVTPVTDENGVVTKALVTMVKEGSAVITVVTEDGGYKDTCNVIFDKDAPYITDVQPAPGTDTDPTYVGPTARTLNVYAHDNTGVEKIIMEYKEPGAISWQKDVYSDLDEADRPDVLIRCYIPVDPYTHGDQIQVRLTPVDSAGIEGETWTGTYTIDKEGPQITDLAGTWNADTLAVDLSWKAVAPENEEGYVNAEDIQSYGVYRKIAGNDDKYYVFLGSQLGYANLADYTWSDTKVENADASYTYKIEALDRYGNITTYTIDVDTTHIDLKPEVVLNCAATMAADKDYVFDLSASSDDSALVSMSIDFGDGTAVEEKTDEFTFTHAYALAEGETEKTVTVTATATDDAGQTTTVEKSVRIVELSNAGMLTVQVVDEDGIPVANAPVYFNMGEPDQVITNTDRTGKAEFTELPGMYAVGCYIAGYLPIKEYTELTIGEMTEMTLTLEEKDLVEAEFESHRMTLDELREAEQEGLLSLDPNVDPDNYHVLQYNVELKYDVIQIYTGSGVSEGISAPEGYYVFAPSEDLILILEIPVAVSMLKEFYEVNLYVVNNAAEEFSLLENRIHLNVPDGLAVVESANPVDVELEEIKGGTTETVSWILRGDKSGEYNLTADYSGILSQFNVPVTATFESEKAITVYGIDNLEVVMEIPDRFMNNEFYYNLIMSNTAEAGNNDADMYLPGLNGEGQLIQTMHNKEDGTTAYLAQMPEVLKAAESIERFYRITDQISEQMSKYPNYDDFVYVFREGKVKELTSYGVPLKVRIVPGEELLAKYEAYRAEPAEDVVLTAPVDVEYGYSAEGDGAPVITAAATPADNAEYDLTYTWYDTNYDVIGTGESLALPADLDAGDYHYHVVVTATRKDNGNTADTQYQDIVVTIAPQTVQLEWTDPEDLVYDGTEKKVTAAVVGLKEGETCEVTLEGASAVDAGIYTAKAVALSNKNYRLPEAEDGSGDGSADGSGDGTGTGSADGSGDGDAQGTGSVLNTEHTYTILPRTVQIEWADETASANAQSGDGADAGTGNDADTGTGDAADGEDSDVISARVYDGIASKIVAKAAGLVEGDEVVVTVEGGTEKNAGTHTAKAVGLTGAASGNYVIPDGTAAECQYVIEQKEVALSWSGDADLVYDGTAKNVAAQAEGLAEADAGKVAVTVEGGDAVNAGNYVAKATALSGEAAGNYKLPAAGSGEGGSSTGTGEDEASTLTHAYVIAPKEVILAWSGYTDLVYDGTAKNVTAAVSNLVEADAGKVNVTVEGGSEINAGSYVAKATALAGEAAGNYKLPEAALTQAYEIAAAEAALIWSGYADLVYDGTAKNVTATVGNLIEADAGKVSVTVEGGSEINAGSYVAKATALTGEAAGNYKLPEVGTADGTGEGSGAEAGSGESALTQAYEIAPAQVTLVWSGYENLIYDGNAKNVTATVSSLIAADTGKVSVTVEGGSEINAGSYVAKATALTGEAARNYKLPETGATDGAGEGSGAGTGSGEGSGAGDGSGEGSGAVDGSSETSALTQAYEIAPAEVTLTWSGDADLVYDGTAKNVTAAVSNLIEADAGKVSVTVEGGSEINAGSYTAKATALTGEAAGNYKLPDAAAGSGEEDGDSAAATITRAYEIAKRPVQITWSGTEVREADGTASAVKADVANKVGTDDVTVVVTGGDETEAGTYTAKVASLTGTAAGNYELASEQETTYVLLKKAAVEADNSTGVFTADQLGLIKTGDDDISKAVAAALAKKYPDGKYPEGTVFQGELVITDETPADAANAEEPYLLFDISLYLITNGDTANKEEIQPGGAITITLPIPAGYEKFDFTLLHITSEDPYTQEEVTYTRNAENTITFTVTSLSPFKMTNFRCLNGAHTWGEWAVTKEATITAAGVKTRTCSVCGETQSEEVPKLDPNGDASDPESAAALDAAIAAMTSDGDPANSAFAPLKVKMKKASKKYVTITWTKVSGASGYLVYGSRCGNKYKMAKLADTTGKTYKYKGLSAGKAYKLMVAAYKIVNGQKKIVAVSKIVHIVTTGSKKFGNYSKVTITKKPKSLKVKKSFKLKVKMITKAKKVKTHRKLSFESSNPKVATVSKKGKIKAVGKGTCYIYAYVQNGIYAKVKVKVK